MWPCFWHFHRSLSLTFESSSSPLLCIKRVIILYQPSCAQLHINTKQRRVPSHGHDKMDPFLSYKMSSSPAGKILANFSLSRIHGSRRQYFLLVRKYSWISYNTTGAALGNLGLTWTFKGKNLLLNQSIWKAFFCHIQMTFKYYTPMASWRQHQRWLKLSLL